MALTQASEDGLKISNAGTNGQFLQKQSGNTGGLTWATAITDNSDKASLSGATFTGNVVVSNSFPGVKLTDTDNDSDYSIYNSNGTFMIYDDTNSANRVSINSSGLTQTGSVDITGDVSLDGKLGAGGANYGTAGQVLTSGGSGSDISWAAVPPGGNSIDLVADLSLIHI